jgi:hypothetical protein
MSRELLVVEHDARVEQRADHRPPPDAPRLLITTVLDVATGPAGVAVRAVRRGLA